MKSRLLIIFNQFILFVCLILFPSLSYALKTDRSQPLIIHSETAHGNIESKNLEITGSVYLTQGSMKIHGNQLIVKKENEKKIIIINGSPASFEQILDYKNNLGKNKIFKATARQVNYNTGTRIVNLIGNAHAKIDKNEVSGNTIIYHTVSEEYTVKAGSKKRATMIIYPD